MKVPGVVRQIGNERGDRSQMFRRLVGSDLIERSSWRSQSSGRLSTYFSASDTECVVETDSLHGSSVESVQKISVGWRWVR